MNVCPPHISSAQHSVTLFLCHTKVHFQAAPLLISNPPLACRDFSGLGSLFSLLLSGPVVPFVLLESKAPPLIPKLPPFSFSLVQTFLSAWIDLPVLLYNPNATSYFKIKQLSLACADSIPSERCYTDWLRFAKFPRGKHICKMATVGETGRVTEDVFEICGG